MSGCNFAWMALMQEDRENKPSDVLIIGAGATGLMAAIALSEAGKSVAVVEALNRTGGRMHTVQHKAFEAPVELGAEFVHGDLPLTKKLLQAAGAPLYKVAGSIWQHHKGTLQQQEDFMEDYEVLMQRFKTLQGDLPVADFLKQHLQDAHLEELRFTLKSYVEGYYAADTHKASTRALCEELTKEEEEQYRIGGGYQRLVRYLEQQCLLNGVRFFLGQPVWQLHWQAGAVEAITEKESIKAAKALVTVSIGVLQREGITFFPALPQKTTAARALGFGHVIKINLQFAQGFWKDKILTQGKDLHDLNFLFAEASIPTWWTQHPRQLNMLTGWLAGPGALQWKDLSEDELLEKALQSLDAIFGIKQEMLRQQLQGVLVYNWSADPHFNGAYSFEVVNGRQHMQALLEPVANTIYFAGEGLHQGPEIGTVEGALASGKAAAAQMLKL